MKKILLCIILVAMALVACEKNERGDNGSNNDFVLPKLPDPDDVCSIMEDINFMRYCIENFDVNHDGKVSPHETNAVFEMKFNPYGQSPFRAKSLKGIEYFTNLIELHCQYITLSGCLDLRNNTKLQMVICFGNEITSLLLGNAEVLKELHCGSNLLTNLDISQCISLLRLECGNNQLTSLDLSKCISLKNTGDIFNSTLEELKLNEFITSYIMRYTTRVENFKIIGSGLESLDIHDFTESIPIPQPRIIDATQCPKLRRIEGSQSTSVEKVYVKKGHIFDEGYGELIHYVD